LPARDDLSARLQAFMRKASPFAYCDACLALRVNAGLGDVREALDTLAADGRTTRTRRACYGCGRTLELSALREEAGG
jgi:hypothetical protein